MTTNRFYKRNYKDALDYIIPEVYFTQDLTLSGTQPDAIDSIINSHINFCVNQPTILSISAAGTFSSINEVSSLSRWFIPQNKINNLTAKEFEIQILHPLGICMGDLNGMQCTYYSCPGNECNTNFSGVPYTNIVNVFKDTLFPKIILNSDSLQTTTSGAFSTTPGGTHEYLINRLGWIYFLNTASAGDASSYIASSLADMYVSGTNFSVKDGIKGLSYYVYNNWPSLSSTYPGLLPSDYTSGTTTYVSGTQPLDRLHTLIDVIYSDQYSNKDDTYVRDAFDDYVANSTLLTGRERAGPFSKFIKGVSYSFFDTRDEVERLESLYDIENCPPRLLKYVADLIGWDLKGSNPEGWRRQLLFATTLYKQRGTKKGLYNAITTVLPGVELEESSISEFYESYIPYLAYYLLNTDSALFESLSTWTQEEAFKYTGGEYDPASLDNNVRIVIDHMMLKAVTRFPELFYVKNFKFDLTNPDFVFFYRGRSFSIPPWEEEKFYMDCESTPSFLQFIKNELICLGVSYEHATNFYNYAANNISQKNLDTRFYNNGLLFFTSSINLPPNESTILDNYKVEKYKYLPLWNAKSSHFNVSVSSGSFTDSFFNSTIYTKQDFFQSLSIVDEFSPAKSIPRTHVDLQQVETLSAITFNCPSVRYLLYDISLSGFPGSVQSSGVDIRNIPYAVGGDFPTPDNSSRARNDHTNLPVYKRDFVDSPGDFSQLAGSSVSAVPLTQVDRTNVRRRDFSKTLQKGGWYTRTGRNMPSYFNTSSQGADTEFAPLGFVNILYKYNPVINPYDLDEVSGYPHELNVWSPCWTLNSDKEMSGIYASSTFDIRGSSALVSSTCDSYVRRERTPEFQRVLHKLLDKKYEAEARAIYAENKSLLDTSAYLDPIASLKNTLWSNGSDDTSEIYNFILGNRRFSRDSIDGMHKMFKDYIDYFTNTGIGNGLLDTYTDGGANILSHVYGPLFLNGRFTLDGSALDATVSSTLEATTMATENPFSISDVSSLNNITASSVQDMPVEKTEFRNPYILSGMEFTDFPDSTSKFSFINLDDTNASVDRDNYVINNPLVVVDTKNSFPRLRFNLKDYGANENFLIPERDFKLSVNAAIGTKNSDILGGGNIGAWIHTDVEDDYHGNKVFWNFMPDGSWRKLDAAILQTKGAVNYVKQYLTHSLDYSDQYTIATDPCPAFTSDKDVIVSMQEEDFITRSVDFNTRNIKIKVPYSYFKAKNQVHRTSQNYIVEVFSYDNTALDKFIIFDYVSVVDIRQSSRDIVKHPITYNTYSLPNTVLDDLTFLDSKGNVLPEGTNLDSDSNGNISTSSGDKVTTIVAQSPGQIQSLGILYDQMTIQNPYSWVIDDSSNVVRFEEYLYDGVFSVGASGTVIPSSIILEGKAKGSNVTISEVASISLDGEEILAILREFNRLQTNLGARDKTINAPLYGPEGGSRINYRVAPIWAQNGGVTQFESGNSRQYSDITVEN
jgi:hypothetical protein